MSLTSPWLILFMPLVAAFAIAFGLHRHKVLASTVSLVAVWGGFLITCTYVPEAFSGDGSWAIRDSITWLRAGDMTFTYGILIDGLSLIMLLVVTGVGGLIHVYSLGYMHGDPGFSRFFASLSLFVFSMLGIVVAENFFQIFIHWELVGVSSYLLIGYYFRKDSAVAASNKAFLTNRVGDFGFLLGILMLFHAFGTADFAEMAQLVNQEGFLSQPAMELDVGGGHWVTTHGTFLWIAGALVFMGVMGKSAQFPLHVWLPDAMEGPTPVSALIHAATMVAAGVFLLARVFFLYMPSEIAMTIIAYIGLFTAFFAATIAVAQYDIKRVLAFSTLSQLGYMVMAIGLGGTDVAMYHLATHAFFKACLFLGAGSVIHAVHSNDMREMGALWRKMPLTFWTFLISTLALCGLPPFSGFWSKDGILHLTHAADAGPIVYWLPTITAVLTSFYMMRLLFMTFLGAPRYQGEPHESPPTMTMPLVVLAALAVIAGPVLFSQEVIETFRTITRPETAAPFEHIHGDVGTVLAAVLIFALGAIPAWLAFGKGVIDPDKVKAAMGPLHRFLENRWYIDEVYQWVVDNVQQNIARFCDGFDRIIVIGMLVNGSAWTARAGGAALARVQSGSVRVYVLFFLAGVAALLALNL